MKKLFITIFLLFICSTSFSQVYKWRSSDFSLRVTQDGEWRPWTEWASSSVLIVAQEQRVNVYSPTPQVYDMISTVTRTYDENSSPIYTVMCVDENGKKCKMIWYHSSTNGSYVIFQFSDVELMYKVISLDN